MNDKTLHIEYACNPDAVRRILEALPEWFGDPVAVDESVADACKDEIVSSLARDSGTRIGVVLVRRNLSDSAKLSLIAISPELRPGAGKELIDCVVADHSKVGCMLLSGRKVVGAIRYPKLHYVR